MLTVVEKVGDAVGYVLTPLVLPVVERNLVPDIVLRFAIRQQLAGELAKLKMMSTTQIQVLYQPIN